MADTKISALSAAAAAALANEIAINEAGASKKLTVQKILDATGILAASGAAALADEALVAQSDVAKSMSIQKILDAIDVLGAAAAFASTTTFPVVQSSVAKEGTLAQLITYLQTLGMPRVLKLASQHDISSATATKVTGLDMALEAGSYVFRYHLIIRQATSTSDGPQFGINFNGGSVTQMNFMFSFASADATLLATLYLMDNVGTKALGFMDAMTHNAVSTTAPNMGNTVGVGALAADIPCYIDGIITVATATTIELYHGAEGTNQSSLMPASALVMTRVA